MTKKNIVQASDFLSFDELEEHTYQENSWNIARNSDSISNAPGMEYEHLSDEESPDREEILENLREVSNDIVL